MAISGGQLVCSLDVVEHAQHLFPGPGQLPRGDGRDPLRWDHRPGVDDLEVAAQSAPIGTPNRWLNPGGVADLDGDGATEIAAVTTPHIGGVLRVYRRDGERLVELVSLNGFSNHVYRSPELGLSRPARIDGRMQLLVPDVRRTSVRVIALEGDRLVETGRCELEAPITGPDALRDCEAQLTRAP